MKFEEVTINSMEDFLLLAKRQQWQVVLNYRDRCGHCGNDRNEVLIQDDDGNEVGVGKTWRGALRDYAEHVGGAVVHDDVAELRRTAQQYLNSVERLYVNSNCDAALREWRLSEAELRIALATTAPGGEREQS